MNIYDLEFHQSSNKEIINASNMGQETNNNQE